MKTRTIASLRAAVSLALGAAAGALSATPTAAAVPTAPPSRNQDAGGSFGKAGTAGWATHVQHVDVGPGGGKALWAVRASTAPAPKAQRAVDKAYKDGVEVALLTSSLAHVRAINSMPRDGWQETAGFLSKALKQFEGRLSSIKLPLAGGDRTALEKVLQQLRDASAAASAKKPELITFPPAGQSGPTSTLVPDVYTEAPVDLDLAASVLVSRATTKPAAFAFDDGWMVAAPGQSATEVRAAYEASRDPTGLAARVRAATTSLESLLNRAEALAR